MYQIFFICSSIHGHSGWFCISAIKNSNAMNTGCGCLFDVLTSFPLDICTVATLLGPVAALFLADWGTSTLFSIMAMQSFTPTLCGRVALSPHLSWNLLLFFCLCDNHSHCGKTIYCGFDLHFPDDQWC